jgi:hypothetical protein
MTSHAVAPRSPEVLADFITDAHGPRREFILHHGKCEELIENCGHDGRGTRIPREDSIEFASQTVRITEPVFPAATPPREAKRKTHTPRVRLASDGAHAFAQHWAKSVGVRVEVTCGMNETGAAKEYLGGKILARTRRSPGIDESHCRGAKRSTSPRTEATRAATVCTPARP